VNYTAKEYFGANKRGALPKKTMKGRCWVVLFRTWEKYEREMETDKQKPSRGGKKKGGINIKGGGRTKGRTREAEDQRSGGEPM